MKRLWNAILAAAIIMPAARLVGAQTVAPITGAGTITIEPSNSDAARLNPLIAELGNSDFARREAAQKELEKRPPEDLKFLREAAEAATNAEIKSRLVQAVTIIQDNAILNPPPISLVIEAKGLEPAIAALSDAIHVKMEVGIRSRVGRDPMIFNLNARNAPFWEVFFALAKQHPLVINQDIRSLQVEADADGWRSPFIAGPMAVIPQSITRTRVTKLQANPGAEQQPEVFTLACTVALDPRVPLSKIGPIRFTQVTDDLGNNLAPKPPDDQLQNARRIESYPPQSVFPQSIPLRILDRMGKRITSAKGSVHFVVEVGEERVEIPNADKRTGETFAIGSYKFKLSRFEVTKREAVGTIPPRDFLSIALENVRDSQEALRIDDTKIISLALTDANGREMAKDSRRIIGGLSLTAQPDGVAPFKLTLSMTNRTKDLVIPFELKDLPLP